MRRWLGLGLITLLLSGCVAEPAPYYGGGAPYYGTAYTPGYVGIGIGGGGYYPYYNSHHIRSNYNNDYWHWHNHGSAGGWHGGGGHNGGHGGGGHH